MAKKINYKTIFSSTNSSENPIRIISIDPSGNKIDGHGHTGLVDAHAWIENEEAKIKILCTVTIPVEDSQKLLDYIKVKKPAQVIVEDYINYNKKATQFKRSETTEILRDIKKVCEQEQIPVFCPVAAWHKTRYSDAVLKQIGVDLKQLNSKHEKDALRMLLKFCAYELEKIEKIEKRDI